MVSGGSGGARSSARDQALIALAMSPGLWLAARRAPLGAGVKSARSRTRRRGRLAHR